MIETVDSVETTMWFSMHLMLLRVEKLRNYYVQISAIQQLATRHEVATASDAATSTENICADEITVSSI